VLRNRVDLYHETPTLTATTGPSVVGVGTQYPSPFAASVPCSVQPQEPRRSVDDEFQPGTTEWIVLFGAPPGLKPNDLIVWTDDDGTTRYLVVTVVRNLAGRGASWKAECYERIS